MMKSNAKFDPELKNLMVDLQAVFDKYQTFGFVTATSRTHGEFKFFFPKHSVATVEKKGIRVLYKKDSGKPEDLNATVFALLTMGDMGAYLFKAMRQMQDELDRAVGVDHKPAELHRHGED